MFAPDGVGRLDRLPRRGLDTALRKPKTLLADGPDEICEAHLDSNTLICDENGTTNHAAVQPG